MRKWMLIGGTCAYLVLPAVIPVITWLPWIVVAVKAYPLVSLAMQAPKKTWYQNVWDTIIRYKFF